MDTMNWIAIAALVVSLVIAGVLIYLFKMGKMNGVDITNIAGLIDSVGQVFKGLGMNNSIVSLFAKYASEAVRVVEQLVKNGELEKDNELRKNEAREIVEQLALADGVDLNVVYENEAAIDNLIEAAVNKMQSSGLKIEFGSEELIESSPEVE